MLWSLVGAEGCVRDGGVDVSEGEVVFTLWASLQISCGMSRLRKGNLPPPQKLPCQLVVNRRRSRLSRRSRLDRRSRLSTLNLSLTHT